MNGSSRIYHRKPRRAAKLLCWGETLGVRLFTRAFACLFLISAIGHGLVAGGHLPAPETGNRSMIGRIAPIFGYSAQTIRIGGLKRQSPQKVLAALAIEPGSALFGFDEATAERLLQNIDWIEEAKVRRLFPNTLEIDITEREPFAIWQNEGSYYVIDRTGAAMSLSVSSYAGRLPLVSGRGAPAAVYELFTQLEPHLHLRAKLKAAARVGGRRWNLYFGNNVKVALPEIDVEGALRWIEWTDAEYGLLSKGLVSVDLRLEDRVAILPSPVESADGLKVSERE